MDLFDIQLKINEFTEEKGINSRVDIRIIDLASEVGELSKEVLKGTDYGKKQFRITEGWKNEIGDVLFSLICIANNTDVNLEECLNKVIDKYEKRFAIENDLGSGK